MGNGEVKASKQFQLAYLATCTNENPYCEKLLAGIKDAAAKARASVRVFDAAFNPAQQLNAAQDAATQHFDGYLFTPVTDNVGCQAFRILQATKAPVGEGNSPMCGDPRETKGAVGYVAMHGVQEYYDLHVANAFASCDGNCEAIVLGGPVSWSGYDRWQLAVKHAQQKYPNVKVVTNQSGDFNPQTALRVVQDALRAHSGASLLVSADDDMSRAAVQAISAAGKVAGRDVHIYSVGASSRGTSAVQSGEFDETTIITPYTEGYYMTMVLLRYLISGEQTPGLTWEADAPKLRNGIGTLFLTKENVSQWQPEW